MIKRTYGAHPLIMLNTVKPFLFVLILPVIKGLVQYLLSGRVTGILSPSLFAAALVSAVAFLNYRAFKVSVENDRIVIHKGFFINSVSVIRRERLSSVTAIRGVSDLVFGSVTFRINTEAGTAGKTDFSFKLHKKDGKELFSLLYGDENQSAVRFSPFKSAVLAAATSSAITGLVVGVPIINNLGKILGVALSKTVFDEISNASGRFDAYFPPAVNLITGVLIAGYLASFLITFIKMLGFRLKTGKGKTEVEYGVIARKHTVFKKSAVNDLCIEQTPIMRMFKMFSMRAAVGGYGDNRGEKAIIVPAGQHGKIINRFKGCFDILRIPPAVMRAERSKRNVMRFLWLARIYAELDVAFTLALSLIFPSVSRFLILLGAVLMALTVYYGNLCLISYRRGGLVISDKIFASGFSGLTVRELYCEKTRVGEIRIARTPADKLYGTCKVDIIVRSESADKIRVSNLKYSQVLEEIQKSFEISE